MCRPSIAIDQSIHTIAPIFDELERSPFYIRSIRVVPVAWSRKADVRLSLGGGSRRDLDRLLASLGELPAVLQRTIRCQRSEVGIISRRRLKKFPEALDGPRARLSAHLSAPDYQLGRAADRAGVPSPLKSIRAGELACLVIGVLPHGEAKLIANTIVANRLRSEPFNQPANLIEYRHSCPQRAF